MTGAAASGNALLEAHVRLIRDTADLVERSGIPGLVLCPDQDEIVILWGSITRSGLAGGVFRAGIVPE